MDRAKLSAVLGHQLKGIMLHSDLCKMALYEHNKRYAAKHYRQVLEETKTFMLTNEFIIDKLGVIVEPLRETQFIVPANASVSQMDDLWYKWEHDTYDMYKEMSEGNPECGFWKKLVQGVKRELTTI